MLEKTIIFRYLDRFQFGPGDARKKHICVFRGLEPALIDLVSGGAAIRDLLGVGTRGVHGLQE